MGNKVFGPESKLEIFNKSIHKVVIHYVPTYISDEDVNTHFKDEGIGISEIKSKSLNDINTQNVLLEKKWLKICNKKFKISKYINKKITQCFRCQKFGHTANICYVKNIVCRFCSKNHNSKDCDQKNNLKCSNCGENHKLNSFQCKHKQMSIVSKNRWILKEEFQTKLMEFNDIVIEEAKKIPVN